MKLREDFHGWQDVVELAIAFWLISSPFVLGFFSNTNASLSCILIGCLVVTLSMMGVARETPWEEWTTICLAALLLATPWLFSFASITIAVFNVLISGGLLIVFSALAMRQEYREIHEHQRTVTIDNS